jgi:hypothetical protein
MVENPVRPAVPVCGGRDVSWTPNAVEPATQPSRGRTTDDGYRPDVRCRRRTTRTEELVVEVDNDRTASVVDRRP